MNMIKGITKNTTDLTANKGKTKIVTLNKVLADSEVKITTVCRSCGQLHFMEVNDELPDKVSMVADKWLELGVWLMKTKCTKCASPVTMELFIGVGLQNFTLSEFWAWFSTEVAVVSEKTFTEHNFVLNRVLSSKYRNRKNKTKVYTCSKCHMRRIDIEKESKTSNTFIMDGVYISEINAIDCKG